MMIIDSFFSLFLSWYLSNVLPANNGPRKPWYFLFTKDYWFSDYKKKNYLENGIIL